MTPPLSRFCISRGQRLFLTSIVAEVDEPRRLADDTGLVFSAPRTGKPLSDNTLSKALRTADIPATVHGFRASLRDWLAAEGVPDELAEAVLAHQPRGIAKSYRRDDLLVSCLGNSLDI